MAKRWLRLLWQSRDQHVDWTLYGTSEKNGCDVTKISSEWPRLKTYIFPMLHNSPNESYLEIWHRIFTNNEVMAECQNIMHIFEILMIVPFTNAIAERLLSRMNRVKTDFRNRLWRSRLDTCLCVGEGPSIKDFETDHVIDCWWAEKERRLKSPPHNYPAKKRPPFNSAECWFFNTYDVWFRKQWWWEVFFLIDIHVCNSILLLLTFRFSVYKRLTWRKTRFFKNFPSNL